MLRPAVAVALVVGPPPSPPAFTAALRGMGSSVGLPLP